MGGAGAGRGGGGVEDGEGGGLGRLVLPPVRHARRQIGVAGDGEDSKVVDFLLLLF